MIDQLTLFLRGIVLEHTHLAIFAILYACGLGVPIPEEITLLLTGYAAYHGRIGVLTGMILCVAAILSGDLTMFFIARRWGRQLLKTRFFAWLLPAARLEKVEKYFEKHGSKTVFFARFFAGIRMPVYFVAGTMKMNPLRFAVLDLAGALISGPTSVWIAYKLSDDFDNAMKKVKNANHWILGGAVVLVSLSIAWHLWSDHRERRKARAAAAPDKNAGEAPPGPV
ncbi:MAG: DedA family protein [Planctomycetes bacterium]|nr:DedA family protein [Planctomycetota bacterium]